MCEEKNVKALSHKRYEFPSVNLYSRCTVFMQAGPSSASDHNLLIRKKQIA